jgi:hypothetical protein
MKHRFINANLCSILVAVTALFTPSITHEKYCATNISHNESRLVLRIHIPLYQIYRKLPH